MNSIKGALMGVAAVFMASMANASPFTLYYDVQANGSNWDYDFQLVLDNNDSSFVAGQSFDWFIIGDAQSSASPFSEGFTFFTDVPSGWTATSSSGGHNGPTLCFVPSCASPYWLPAEGDQLTFSGSSSTYLAEGDLLWSNITGSNTTQFASAVKGLPSPVPLPAGLPLLASGAVLLGLLRRRKAA
ncbi:VPLPA-CTERM sorting domain-containing protein [Arenibacterium sp. CAU 1754]